LPHIHLRGLIAAVAFSSALLGCASTPEVEPPPEPVVVAPAPDDLNLPEPSAQEGCACPDDAGERTENYFDRGVRALAARDYARARIYFERHRDSELEQARREADVGIAFVTLLDRTVEDGETELGASGVDERAEVMILAMSLIDLLEAQLQSLEALNQTLSIDLEKREEALKRLRDLTLGQPEGRQ
jgi:hypothetical protein